MNEFKESGTFWLPNDQNIPLAGELTFDHQEGVRLSLIGTFDTWLPDFPDNLPVLTGTAGKHDVTLLQVRKAKSLMSSSGVATQQFRANELLIGHSFESEDQVRFTAASIQFYGLAKWIDHSGIEDELTSGKGVADDQIQLTYTRPKTMTAELADGSVSVQFVWSRSTGSEEWTLTHFPCFYLDYSSPIPQEDILRHVAHIQSLIALCLDTPVATRNITFYNRDIRIQMLDGHFSKWEQPIDYRAQAITTPSTVEKFRSNFSNDLSYNNIGGIDTIARWISIAEEYSPAINLLTSVRSGMGMYIENRFLNIVGASEAFHRIRHGGSQIPSSEYHQLVKTLISSAPVQHQDWLAEKLKYLNEPTLRKRLQSLAAETRTITGELTGKPNDWGSTIAQTRNALTHYSKHEKDKIPGAVLYWLGEAVHYVLRVNLLKECMTDSDSLSKLTLSAESEAVARAKSAFSKAREIIKKRTSDA